MKSSTISVLESGALPEAVQRRADKAYRLWPLNPSAHWLDFKRVGQKRPVYSVRIGRGTVRSVYSRAIRSSGFGSEAIEYERLLKSMGNSAG